MSQSKNLIETLPTRFDFPGQRDLFLLACRRERVSEDQCDRARSIRHLWPLHDQQSRASPWHHGIDCRHLGRNSTLAYIRSVEIPYAACVLLVLGREH